MEKYDPSQLTEFPRFESESTQSGVSSFLNKIWKLPLFSQGETSDGKDKDVVRDQQEAQAAVEQDYDDIKPETGAYAVEFEGRSLPNVLKRISSLVALGSGGGTRYADTELARYWMPDDISRECYECAARFSTLRRRHHCRVCGQIFCSRCCSQRVPGQIFGCSGGLRVCTYCCTVVLSYLREHDLGGDMSPDLRTLQDSLQAKFPETKTTSGTSASGPDNFMLWRAHEEREARPASKEALHDVFTRLVANLPTQQHRYRLVRYNGVWQGCDILQWLMENTDNKTRAQAKSVCQNLLTACYMECSAELRHFADYGLYKPISLPPPPDVETPEEGQPRLVESVSSYCLDLNLGENSARLTKATRTEEVKASPASEEENPILDQNEGPTEIKSECKAIAESGTEHLLLLTRQCLAREGLGGAWLNILFPLCRQAADSVVLDMYSNDIDVRNYVQVKKAPGGEPSDSCVIPGVVMTKNVAHRGMPQQLTNPTVLLLDCSIAYQRVEGKLTSLEPVLLQEQEYLIRCAARISALRPKVLLVRGTCARAVQDVLRNDGVALATGVGAASLARAARAVRADVVTSIDARIGLPRLGTCGNFYVKTFSNKTLMVLENCAEPQLGCCILLRGASLEELVRVKKVAKFITLACYNWKLERSFLCDTEAILPDPGMTFCDDETDHGNEKAGNDGHGNEKSGNHGHGNENLDGNENKSVNSNDIHIEQLNKNTEIRVAEIEDPLNKVKSFRKTESDKNLSCGVPIKDNSDPLRARQTSVDDEVFLSQDQTVFTAEADTDHDRWSTDDMVLSMSPHVVVPPPRAPLPARAPPRPTPRLRRRSWKECAEVVCKELHPFVKTPITAPIDDLAVRAALAHFRATGCRNYNNNHKIECPLYKPTCLKPPKEKEKDKSTTESTTGSTGTPIDPLAPDQHQRLSLLLYSFSEKSANVPDFCVNPWIATMEMYGRHDITLGAFLHKYCFSGESKCPSAACSVPMNQHVRRFVHGDVCLTITCNTIGHSNVDKVNENQNKQVMFWTRCQTCGASGRGSRLSRASLCLSLAVYLSLRARAPRYVRAGACAHPWRALAHCFASHAASASIKYNKITTWDIEMPPHVITIKYDTKQMRDDLINQVNDLVLKGHETFTSFTDSESEKDHIIFKQHIEQIHVALTSNTLQEQASPARVVRSLWGVSDRILYGEKMRRDAQEKWSSPAKPSKSQQETAEEKQYENEETTPAESGTENAEPTSKDETDRTGTEEDEEKGDKKTVRQIISQLLSNNQTSNQCGIIITSGVVVVRVSPGDVGSVVAATLASRQCRIFATTQPVQEESESANSNKDKSDGEKSKANKPSEHIEVLLKEGLLCRVYYAQQFHRLRHMLLAPLDSSPDITDDFAASRDMPTANSHDKCDCKTLCDIEEGFIRSLAYCVPWAARGGKSGSTFCKTTDDRYVLKEMTRPEWQQFLEFAPHYFNYVTSCRQNNQPSLLARILGVYSVGGAGTGVLVLENVFYARENIERFDLKGSSRHRLAAPQPSAVLMDENLLNMRWQTQLYLQSGPARRLAACLERDTAFLAAHSVMDYSLLLGVDSGKLVLGLIDYIRTFTWDKKLEHYVKRNLGAGQPTVVSPLQYKARLIAAAKKYFPRAAGHWDHLTDNVTD